jgi:CBS domain-containing protein
MRVRDLMTRHVETCRSTDDLASAAMIMWRNDCGMVPVTDDGKHVVGIITDRDICMAAATRHLRPEEIPVGDVVTHHVVAARSDDDLKSALDLMRTEHIRRLPVIDQEKRLEGVLSINDVILGAVHGGNSSPSMNDVMTTLQGICAHNPQVSRTQGNGTLRHTA